MKKAIILCILLIGCGNPEHEFKLKTIDLMLEACEYGYLQSMKEHNMEPDVTAARATCGEWGLDLLKQ